MAKMPNTIYRKDLGKTFYTSHNPIAPDEFLSQHFNAVLDHPVSIDGKIHRFRPNGSREKDGWYVFSEVDGIVFGKAGDWRKGKDNDVRYAPEGKISDETLQRMAEKQKSIEEERTRQKQSALLKLKSEWFVLPSCTEDHPYLQRKNVKIYGDIRMTDKSIVIPMYDSDGELTNRQAINDKGEKRFGAFMETTGARYVIEGSGAVFLCEGYATGASIHEATGAEVIVCFSAGNLKNVAKDYPGAVVVADNDASETGENEAKKTGLKYILIPEVGMDANDFANEYGLEELANLLNVRRKREDDWLVPFSQWRKEYTPQKWLIKGYVPEGEGTSMIFGPTGCGKTFITLDMLLHIATGKPWHGHKVKQAGVAYFCGEGYGGLKNRIDAWCLKSNVDPDSLKNFYICRWPVDLNDPVEMKKYMEQIEKLSGLVGLAAIDTLNRFFSGDENKADDIHALLDVCEDISLALGGVHELIVHHTGIASEKENRARGNPALKGAMQVELMVMKNPDTGQILLKQTKQKDMEMMPDKFFTLSKVMLPYYDEDGEQCSSVVPECDEEERNVMDMNAQGAKLLFNKMIKDAFAESDEENVSIDPQDNKTIVSRGFIIKVAKTFYHNRGMKEPYEDEYNLTKPEYKQSFVSMYLKDSIEKYAKGWWKVI
jgi:putative DNA primase/helicase